MLIVSSVAMVIVNGDEAVFAGVLLSVTRNVKVELPADVGVPWTAFPTMFNPAGKLPLVTDHEYGVVPPVAVRATGP